jgi:hypothetical protein
VATGSSEMFAAILQTTQHHNPEDQCLVITLHLHEPAQKMKLTYLKKGLQNTCNMETSQYYDTKTVFTEHSSCQTSRLYCHTMYCTGHDGEDLHVSGNNVLCPLLKTEVWKMEMGRREYCEN